MGLDGSGPVSSSEGLGYDLVDDAILHPKLDPLVRDRGVQPDDRELPVAGRGDLAARGA